MDEGPDRVKATAHNALVGSGGRNGYEGGGTLDLLVASDPAI